MENLKRLRSSSDLPGSEATKRKWNAIKREGDPESERFGAISPHLLTQEMQ